MRLLMLASEFPPGPGGIGTHACQVATQLDRLGWEVGVLAPQEYVSDDEIREFTLSQPFGIHRLRSTRLPAATAIRRFGRLRSHCRRWQPDILIASGARSVWLAAALARFEPLPWVAIGHGTEFGVRSQWQQHVTRYAFEQATAIISVSDYTRRRALEMKIRPKLLQTIPNGADAGRFEVLAPQEVTRCREALGLRDANVLITVGNVTERKGQDIVIRALPQVLAQAPHTHYLIAGLPTRQQSMAELARDLGVADHVHFLGRVSSSEIVRYLNCADLFLMTSRHTKTGDFEGYGIAVVEAAFCGKPAVVSANCGLAEAIVDGVTGLCVPEADHAATAAAILRLTSDVALRTRMGAAARERALREQTWENRAREYDRLLRSLVANRNREVPRLCAS